jgi:hypothetical protein
MQLNKIRKLGLMEKRGFTRVNFSACASVKHDDQVFFCDTQNVSMQGLFIKTNQELPLNTAIEITIYYIPDASFRLIANVVRCEEMGLGIQIKQIDVHSFVHLRDIVAKMCNDWGTIMREMYSMTKCIQ